jgi:hypothetical protein
MGVYDIVTTEPEDRVVIIAVNSIVNGEGAIPGPDGNYRFAVPGSMRVEGDGGTKSSTLVVVAHASAKSLGGQQTWRSFREALGADIRWADVTKVYLAACSTAGEDPSRFLHGSIAAEVKAAFPHATVWASSTNVGSRTQSGDWHIVTGT